MKRLESPTLIWLVVILVFAGLIAGTLAPVLAQAPADNMNLSASGTPLYLPFISRPLVAGENGATEGELSSGMVVNGPAIVQWFRSVDNKCGINKLSLGESFAGDVTGHWWLFKTNQAMEDDYPTNKKDYFANPANAACLADAWPPALPTPTPVATTAPPATVTNTVMPTGTTTPTPTVQSGVIAEGDFPGTALGAGIFEWALDGSCGIYNLLETETFPFTGQGHWWQYANNQAMLDDYAAHKAAYFAKPENSNCHEEFPHVAVTNTPTQTPQNTVMPTATKTPTPTNTSVAPVEGGFPAALIDVTIIEWSIPGESCGIFLLAHGSSFTWTLDGHWWKTGDEAQTSSDYDQHKKEFFAKTHGCTEGAPPAETLGSASAPSVVEWYAVSNPAYCGVFSLNFPKNWLADPSTIQVHSWRFDTQAQLDSDYPGHRDAFLAKSENKTCHEGRPQ